MKTTKKELNLLDRLIVPNLLKTKTSFDIILINDDILEKIKLTQKELLDYQIKVTESGVNWNDKGGKAMKSIEFTELEINEIKEGLTILHTEKAMTREYKGLYQKFCL